MIEILTVVLDIAIVVFAASSMFSVGLGHTLGEIVGPLRHARNVLRALMSNFVLVPALALLILRIVPLEGSLEVGLVLIAVAAGAPFVIKLSEVAGADSGLTATLLILVLPVTVLYMPLVVPVLLPGIAAPADAIARPLLMTMLIPLGVGLLIHTLWPKGALRIRPLLGPLSNVALVVVVLTTLVAHFDAITGIGWRALVATALLVAGAFLLGYLMGGGDHRNREVLGLGTGQRNVAAATIVASQAVEDPATISMVIVGFIVGLAILFPTARLLSRSGTGGGGRPR